MISVDLQDKDGDMTVARICWKSQVGQEEGVKRLTDVIRMWVSATSILTGIRMSWACLMVTSIKTAPSSFSKDAMVTR